jgi:hypothetical protein
MAISTFYPENRETFAPFFFPTKIFVQLQPLFFFLVAKWKNYATKTNADHNFGEEKRKKRKKRHPWF